MKLAQKEKWPIFVAFKCEIFISISGHRWSNILTWTYPTEEGKILLAYISISFYIIIMISNAWNIKFFETMLSITKYVKTKICKNYNELWYISVFTRRVFINHSNVRLIICDAKGAEICQNANFCLWLQNCVLWNPKLASSLFHKKKNFKIFLSPQKTGITQVGLVWLCSFVKILLYVN